MYLPMHISVEYSTRGYTIPIVPKSTGIISENTFNVSIYPAGIPRMNGRAAFIYFKIRLFPFFHDQWMAEYPLQPDTLQ